MSKERRAVVVQGDEPPSVSEASFSKIGKD
jgi:hypothetical protein